MHALDLRWGILLWLFWVRFRNLRAVKRTPKITEPWKSTTLGLVSLPAILKDFLAAVVQNWSGYAKHKMVRVIQLAQSSKSLRTSCLLVLLPWLVWAVAGEGGAKRSCLTSCHCYKATVQGFAGLVMISDSTNELAIGTHFTCTHFHWYPRGQALCIHAKCVNRDKFNSSQSHQCCLLHPYHAYFYLHEPDDMLCLYTFYIVLMSKNPVPFVFFNCKPQGFTTWRRGAGGRSPPKDDQRILQTRLSNPSLEQCKAPT